jgi:tetratricopeptide (TPR) repeat protein
VIGRGKGELDSGFELPFGLITTLYFSPKRVTVRGFSRREAADDYQLAEALERLQKHPDDALARFNAGTALTRLGQPDLALPALDRAAALQPDLADLHFWRAVALIGLQRTAEARAELEETLKQNPLQRHAHRILARLCLDAGEVEQAQMHLAADRRNWPDQPNLADEEAQP